MLDNLRKSLQLSTQGFTDGVADFKGNKRIIYGSILILIVYLIIGGIVYSLWVDNVTFIDAMYFTSVTASTVGYGDISHATTDAQKLFTTFFLLVGVIVVFSIIVPILVEDLFAAVDTARKSARDVGELHLLGKLQGKEHKLKDVLKKRTILVAYGGAIKKHIPTIIACFIPPIVFAFVENWSAIDVIYYTVVTATTVGYGDISPENQWVRLVAILYVPFCAVILGNIIKSVSNVYITRKTRETERKFLNRRLTKKDLLAMDINLDGKVTRGEFLTFMLVCMGKVDALFIEKLNGVFDRLDVDNSNDLTISDLMMNLHDNDDDENDDKDEDEDEDEDDTASVEGGNAQEAPPSAVDDGFDFLDYSNGDNNASNSSSSDSSSESDTETTDDPTSNDGAIIWC